MAAYRCRYCGAGIPHGLHHTCGHCNHPFEECAKCGTLGRRDHAPCAKCGSPIPVPLADQVSNTLGWVAIGLAAAFGLVLIWPHLPDRSRATEAILAPAAIGIGTFAALMVPFVIYQGLKDRGCRFDAFERAVGRCAEAAAMVFGGLVMLIFCLAATAVVLFLAYVVIAFVIHNPGGRPPWVIR